MIINRNRNFLDDWFDRLRGYIARKTMEDAAKFLVTQKHDFIRAVVITSVTRTLLSVPKLTHGQVSRLRILFPELRHHLNTDSRHSFYLWDVVQALEEFELEVKFAGDLPINQANKSLRLVEVFEFTKILYSRLPTILQLPSYEFDIAAIISEMLVVSVNPEVKAGPPPGPIEPIKAEDVCTHLWVPESSENGWRSYCSLCETKAQGSCQG